MNINRRNFTIATTGALLASSVRARQQKKDGAIKWNVLFLMTDQHNVHFMGCDHQGSEGIETPTLDRLAREGMIFRKAYDTYPVCAPTRASLLTSVYPMAHGQYGNSEVLTTAGPDGKYSSIGHVFRNAGYNTAFLGKQHSNVEAYDACPAARYEGKNLFQGFDYRISKSSGHVADIDDAAAKKQAEWNDELMDAKAEQFREKYPEQIAAQPQPEWEKALLKRQGDNDVACSPKKHVADTKDGVWALDTMEYIAALSAGKDAPEFRIKAGKPFCMFLSFPKPHYPWTGPAVQDGTEFYFMYSAREEEENDTFKYKGKDRKKLRIRDVPPELFQADPSVFYGPPDVPRDAAATRFSRARYAGNITWLDHMMGKILDRLETLPDPNNPGRMLSETTIISYTTDHGDMMGEKLGAYNKMKKYEGSARVPFLLKVPGVINPGQRSDILINHVDMWPTIAGLAGLGAQLPTGRDGRDLSAAILKNNPALGPERIFTVSGVKDGSTHPAEVMGRTQRFKFFMLDPRNRREDGLPWMVLFDMDNDPYENNNLAYEPEFRNVVVEETAAIRTFLARYGIEGCAVSKKELATGKGKIAYPQKNDPTEPEEPVASVTPIGTASASDCSAECGPENALDGNVKTEWQAADRDFPHWWMLELNEPKHIDRVVLKTRAARALHHTVEVSNDGKNRTVAGKHESDERAAEREFPVGKTIRYVKVTFTARSGNGWATLGAMELK